MTNNANANANAIVLLDLVNELSSLTGQIDALTARRDQLRTALAEQLPNGGAVGDLKISVSHPKRLNNTKLAAAYPVTEFPEFYKPALDTKAIRRALSPAQLEEYETTGSPVVRIK